MGLLGKQLPKLDRRALLRALTRAYADEWFGHYNYQFAANAMRGHRAPSVLDLLYRKSQEAFVRANRLSARILELGGQPVSKLTDLPEHATDKPFKLPRSMKDVDGILKAVLDAERTSLRSYQALYSRVQNKDVVTERLMEDLLTGAVAGEEELERLLGESAPEMKGG